MSVRDWAPGRKIESPRGMWQSLAQRRTGTPARASAMQNMRIRFGTTRTRPGTAAVFNSTGKVPGMYNWIAPDETNRLVYQDANALKVYDIATQATSTLPVDLTGTRTPSFQPLDVWLYLCGYDTAGAGTIQARIFDGVNTDKAFRAPPDITGWTAVDGGTGFCTQGQHFLGFVYQNRTGYSGKPVIDMKVPIATTTSVSFAVTATSNANPDVLSVPGHTFTDGQTVTGSGAAGDTSINGAFLVTAAVAGVSVQLTDLAGNPIAGNGAYTGGGTLTAPDLISAPGNNILTGNQVTITGSTGDTAINVTGIATVVTAGDTFTLVDSNGNIVNSNGAYTGGGVVSNPIQITLTAGLRQVNISVSLPALADGGTDANGEVQATLFLIATRADNPNLWYFIASDAQANQVGEQPVPFNTPVTLNFVFSFSDEDIATEFAGDTAQANFLFLAQDDAGHGPFNPTFLAAYGNRMCYGDGTTLYASDIGAPQQISADTNQVRMQNQRAIRFAFPLPGNQGLYLTGDRWTGYVVDNGDSPSTWGVPLPVSGTLGAPFPNCVCALTGGQWVWVVTESGPYYFDGNFAPNPLTYLISGLDEQGNPIGWSRVNWAAAYAITIVDDVKNLKVYIAAPLDDATEPNFVFVIDYRLGKTFDSVDISLDRFTPQSLSSLAVVKEPVTGKTNVWAGPAAAGSVWRFDSTTHNDLGAAIDNFWTSGLARGPNIVSSMIRVGSMDVWARGNAPLDANGVSTYLITLFGPDNQVSVPIDLLSTQGVDSALTEEPGIHYMTKFDISQIEDYTIQFRTNAIDSWQELSAVVVYEKEDLFNR